MKKEKQWRVYMHTNNINGKKYIGITSLNPPERRWANGKGYKDNNHFWSSICLYGWDSFTHEILEIVDNEKTALAREKYYIEYYESYKSEYGYNNSISGDFTTVGLYNLPSMSIPVYQYDLNGLFIAGYPSMMEAERQTGINNAAICACCKGVHAFTKDYIWSYEKYDRISPIDKEKFRYDHTTQKQEKIVYQYSLDGIFISSYNSISRASEMTGVDFRLISRRCIEKNGHQMAGGYMWSYTYKGERVLPYKRKYKKRAIEVYDSNGALLKVYDSVREAIIGLSLKPSSNTSIYKCLRNGKEKAYGYIWRYASGH